MGFRAKSKRLLAVWTIGLIGLYSSAPALAKDGTKVLDLNQVDMEEVDDNWDNQSQVPKLNPDNGLKVKDIIEPTSEYTYASFGKPDPFTMPESLAVKLEATSTITENSPASELGPGGKEITVTSPLQAYPLTSLLVKGVWQTAEGEFRAVIITPKKEGVVVKVGDPISSGKILGIEKDSLLVRLYKLRKDGVREYEDSRMNFGQGLKVAKTTIKLEPGKDALFPGEEGEAPAAKAAAPAAPPAAAKAPPPGFVNPDLKSNPAQGAAQPQANAAGTAQGAVAPSAAAAAAPAPAAPAPLAQPASAPASTRPGAVK